MPTDITPLTYGTFYHIYDRGNNRENIFLQERNYAYFLELWWNHINPIAETWAYCLLRNHFHAAVYIRNKEDLSGLKNLTGLNLPTNISPTSSMPMRGVNLATGRKGALFERPFKRIPVGSTSYLMQLIVYIHQNPQKHHFTQDFREWNYSSYHELISDVSTHLQRERIIQLFGSKDDFVRIHQEIQPLEGFEDDD
jgi:REP element-mobilizing transposase RayT